MLVKVHVSYRYVVAICDSDLLGKKFEEGIKQIDLTGNFFRGEEKTKEEVKEIIADMKLEDATFNLAGRETIALALEVGLIEEEGIVRVGDVPVALVLL